ncbi:MAG: xanthine dehydrogenase family protein molybdopterin-binding subunit, partial [Chloroflexota bacterium]
FGSRSIVTGGSAVIEACRKLKEEIILQAARYFSIPREEIQLDGERLLKRGANGRPEYISDLWAFLRKIGKEVEAYSNFTLKSIPFASGAHLCALTVDKETGKVNIHRYVVADDCGRVINEIIVDGQLHGGVAHGIGDMLLSEIPHNEDGAPLATNFMDYMIPTSLDLPNIETIHVETPSVLSLNGAKGVGESGTIGAFPVVFNALNDALQGAGEVDIAPATPEALYKILHKQ